ncbi:MAG TPA: response regulator transcription factor [Candidatus Sulfotelmatobacter sp.]|jgi:DNA-binding NarL/FixJ family response regulator
MAQSAIPMPEKLGKVKVLAAESTRMNSQLLAEALTQDSRLEVAAVEPNQALILAAVAQHRPDVVLISSALESGTQGFDLVRQISSSYPGTQLILLMDSFNPASVVQAFRCGAHGIFSRTESSKGLAKCIHSVHQGQVWANSAELRCVIEAVRESEPMRLVDSGGDAILSKREQDVVRCVAEGLSNREIATSLGLTEHTVKNYLFRIFDKLGVSSRVEVVLYVYRFRQDWVGSSERRSNSAPALGPKLLTRPENRMRAVPPPAVLAGR